MNVFIQGMRRSGTTILYDALLEDPKLRCFYEPFCAGKVTIGGGSGARQTDLFSEARALRKDFQRVRYPSIDIELFNWGGPRDPDLELETDLPDHCRDFLRYLLDSAPEVLVKEVRMYCKVPVLAELDPDAAFVHVVRDPRAVVASLMLGRGRRHRDRFPTADDFFEDRSTRGLWSSRRLSELLLERPEYTHLDDPPDFLRVLLVWKLTFEEARRGGLRCFGDRYLLLRHEEFRSDPVGALASIYRLCDRPMPAEVASWARRHVQPRQPIFAESDPRWLEAFERIGLEEALREGGYGDLLSTTAGTNTPGPTLYTAPPVTRTRTVPQRIGAAMRGSWRRIASLTSAGEHRQASKSLRGSNLRIGIVAWWFNRGQGVVARQLRSALTELGHETFVLGRPWKGRRSFTSVAARSDDVWDQPGVTPASSFEIPIREYKKWASATGIEVAFFDQNYQFEAIAALRRQGVKTIGRFVWEQFSAEHVEPALAAYDVIYSLTRCEQERYRGFGIESPYITWGCHPELFEITPRRDPERVTFHYNAGLLTKRKPYREVVEAFMRTRNRGFRLLIKGQVERHMEFLRHAVKRDPRIELIVADLPTAEHLQLFADSDVCLAPARWEGLGVHLYEAIAFGMPIITNDDPPMNELVEDGFNGLLVRSHQDGVANSGIPAYTPDAKDLASAIERLADPELRERLSEGAREMAKRRSWSRTVSDIGGLLAKLGLVVYHS